MKTAGVGILTPLVVLFCALIFSEASYSQLPSAFPSNATHTTIIRFGSLSARVENERYGSSISMGQSVITTGAASANQHTETGLLAMLLLLSPSDGDLNRDGRIDALDLFILHQWWQRVAPGGTLPLPGDIEPDGRIDYSDLYRFMTLAREKRQTQPGHSLRQAFQNKHSLDRTFDFPGGMER